MRIDSPEFQQLVGDLAARTGESPDEAVRRAVQERWDRLESERRSTPIPVHDVEARLAALRRLQESMALTPEKADAWIADIRAERMAHRIPGDVDPDDATG